jgi:hypothetical protein
MPFSMSHKFKAAGTLCEFDGHPTATESLFHINARPHLL